MNNGSDESSVRWIHEIRVKGVLAFRAGKRGTDLVAQWPGLGTLTCTRAGKDASFAAAPGVSSRAIDKLQGAQVRGLLRDLAGQITVHASAVGVDGRGVLFLGSDGAGKSTAAAEMCMRHGAQMYADDAASLDVGPTDVRLVESEADHWLTGASRLALGVPTPRDSAGGDKQDMRAPSIGLAPCPLALVVALRFDPAGTAAVLRPLHAVDAALPLLEAVFRFDLEDRAARRREFEQLTTIYRSAPFVELVRPLSTPGPVAAFVLDALGRGKS